jgi:organic radical activating enzyme
MDLAKEPAEIRLAVHNTQPVEAMVSDKKGRVDIVQIWPTIQGEGPYAGFPAVFIRTAGCNLSNVCTNCDTDYTSHRKLMTPTAIVTQVQKFLRSPALVVITGGEPFRQNITPLVRLLLNTGYVVQMETNGTFYREDFPYDKVCIVCSPKTPKIDPNIQIDYFKYVLDAEHISEEDGLPTSVLGSEKPPARPREGDEAIPIFVQPADEFDEVKNQENHAMCAAVAIKFGYRVTVQMSKLLGLE